MAGPRVPIVVGILAIAGGITWFALRTSGPEARTAAGSGGLTTAAGSSGSGKAAIFAPEGPSLGTTANAFETSRPVLPDAQVIDAPSHRDVFTAQTRDPAWAPRTEDALKARVRTLGLTVVQRVECRADQCELTVAGSVDEVDAAIAKLEGPKGLSTFARSLLLGRPERPGGDQVTLPVYALFER